jgi:glycosyltransferase involved in cell wall biosynthesis
VLTSVHPPFDARIFHREAKAAREAGYRVTLIAPNAPKGARDGIRLRAIPAWGGRWARPLRWPVLFWKALRTRADIYHGHDPELMPWLLLLQWTTRRPAVYDSHEYLREDILGKQWIPAAIRKPVASLAAWTERFVGSRIGGVVAITEDMADRFRQFQPNTAIVRNLPPTDVVGSLPERRDPAVVYAGLMNSERGLTILYETARLVHERHPECEFRIIGTVEWDTVGPDVPGPGDPRWAGVGVHFFGQVPFEEVAGHLATGTVGWLPRDPDVLNNRLAWPNKLVEYMAAALPIVASDLPTQARVVREAQCGLVVEALSPEAHAEAICRLLEHPEEVKQLAESGRIAAATRYTWSKERESLVGLYETLLQRRG